MQSMSKSSKVIQLREVVKTKIKNVFNTDVFSIYEGIVENIDNVNGVLKVRVPELNDTLYEECRIVTICNSPNIAFIPTFSIGNHVILGFRMFSLNYPVVLGQISPANIVNTPFTDGTVTLKVGIGTLVMNPTSIVLKCGDSSVTISESGIQFSGQYVTANSNDLTKDDIGVM